MEQTLQASNNLPCAAGRAPVLEMDVNENGPGRRRWHRWCRNIGHIFFGVFLATVSDLNFCGAEVFVP